MERRAAQAALCASMRALLRVRVWRWAGGLGSGAQDAAWVRPLLLHRMAGSLQGVGQRSAGGMDPAGVATTAVRVGENSTRRAAGARASTTEHALSRAVSGPRSPTTLQLVPVLRAGHRTLHQPGPGGYNLHQDAPNLLPWIDP